MKKIFLLLASLLSMHVLSDGLDFSELVKGIYILRVDENESANVKFFKILKK